MAWALLRRGADMETMRETEGGRVSNGVGVSNNGGRALMVGRLLVGVLLSGVLGSGLAEATPSLQLSTGGSSVTIQDGGLGDLNSVAGAVTYAGSLGGFYVSISTGISKPALGSAQSPYLDLSSIEVNGLRSGTLTLKFTDTDFSAAVPGTVQFASGIGGASTAGTVKYNTY